MEKIAGYKFRDKSLFKKALTHSSYANEKNCSCNERLEFLGDSVLGLVVSNYLFEKLGEYNEGDLSKIRASLVCEESLAKIARKIDLGRLVRLGRGEELSGGRNRNSILSDTFEAVLAAIYLDSNFKTAEAWIMMVMEDEILEGMKGKFYHDYKTLLQERLQKESHSRVTYRTLREEGPDHNKQFVVEVLRDGVALNEGKGGTKKEAEQMAARVCLENLGERF